MSFEPEFLDMMPDEIVVTKQTSTRDLYGVVTYAGTSATYPARIVYRNKMVRGSQGDQIVSGVQAYVGGAPGLATTDRIALPDGSTPPVIGIERYPDEDGPHHEVVMFQ